MMRCTGELFYYEGYETLAQVAQQSDGCPIFVSLQGQAGWDFETPDLMKGIPVHGSRGVGALEPDNL